MKFLFLDTNIYLDMLIDRNKEINSKVIDNFIKLLDAGKARLIIPELIAVESQRNIRNLFKSSAENISKLSKQLNQINFIINEGDSELLEIKENADNLAKELKRISSKYKDDILKYEEDATNMLNKLFYHKSSVFLPYDDKLLLRVLKRKINKKAPFVHDSKKTEGDAYLIEQLLDLSNSSSLGENAVIYFVSRNTKDFSDTNSKKDLHKHIIADLLNANIEYRICFGSCVQIDFEEELKEVNMFEEWKQQELDARMQIMIDDQKDLAREQFGLPSLFSFDEDYVFEEINNSEQGQNILCKLKKINDYNKNFEELYSEICDLDINFMEDDEDDDEEDDKKKISKVIVLYNQIFECSMENYDDFFEGIRTEISKIKDRANVEYETVECDSFCNDDISFMDVEQNEYVMSFVGLDYMNPDDRESDSIELQVRGSYQEISVAGSIDISYGFADYNEDGGIGEAYLPTIEFSLSQIEDFLDMITDEYDSTYIEIKNNLQKLQEFADAQKELE